MEPRVTIELHFAPSEERVYVDLVAGKSGSVALRKLAGDAVRVRASTLASLSTSTL